jgi:RNase P protein component
MLDIFNIKNTKEAKKPLTVVISKKYIKKATKRNLLKRRACYAYSELVKENTNKTSKNTTLYIKKPLETIPSYKTIKENLCGIL